MKLTVILISYLSGKCCAYGCARAHSSYILTSPTLSLHTLTWTTGAHTHTLYRHKIKPRTHIPLTYLSTHYTHTLQNHRYASTLHKHKINKATQNKNKAREGRWCSREYIIIIQWHWVHLRGTRVGVCPQWTALSGFQSRDPTRGMCFQHTRHQQAGGAVGGEE